MSDLTNYPLQDKFETFLTQELSSTGLLAYCNSVGDFTFPSGVTTNLVLNPGKSNMEIVPISAKDSSAKTFTIDSRNSSQGASVTTTAQTHGVGSKAIISDNYQFWKDIVDAVNSKLDETGGTFTGEVDFSGSTIAGLRVNNLTTAQRTALTPSNGQIVYDTDLGVMYQFIGGAWSTFATGTTSNASDTVAGKVEIATDAEFDADTDTGGTGASLSVLPSQVPATKAEIAQLSGTTNIAEADTFFGATDITGAQAETLSDGSAAESLHYHTKTVIQGTRDITAASGGVTYAHGLSTTPKYIQITARCYTTGANTGVSGSDGFSTGSAHMATYFHTGTATLNSRNSGNHATACVAIYTIISPSKTRDQIATASFDGTNVTLTWTLGEGNSPTQTGTIYFTITVYA